MSRNIDLGTRYFSGQMTIFGWVRTEKTDYMMIYEFATSGGGSAHIMCP